MRRKTPRTGSFATPSQTQRWIRCINQWAKAHRKTQKEVCEYLGFSSRCTWYRLMDGTYKRARTTLIRLTINELGLDANYINGVYDYKSKFSEARNVFTEFKETYTEYAQQGNGYQASQIVRKAAMFMYETLLPKEIDLILEMAFHTNGVEYSRISCILESEHYTINIFGGPQCVMFTFSKRAGNIDLPIMEGDLDIHAVSSIKQQLGKKKKLQRVYKRKIDQFDTNAQKFAI